MDIVKSFAELEKLMNKRIGNAVEIVANSMCKRLKECIKEDYYEQYEPLFYQRTHEFLNSAVYNMLNTNTASIGISDKYMNYHYSLQGSSSRHWTGAHQTFMASLGLHGSPYIYREGVFWETFEKWCDENVIILLKTELRKHGINIKVI